MRDEPLIAGATVGSVRINHAYLIFFIYFFLSILHEIVLNNDISNIIVL